MIQQHVKLDLLLADKIVGSMAYGHSGGGPDYGEYRSRTIVAGGSSSKDAAAALLKTPESDRPKSLRSALWALGEAVDLLTREYQRDEAEEL